MVSCRDTVAYVRRYHFHSPGVEHLTILPLHRSRAQASSLALFSAELGEDKDTWLAALERLADLDIAQASATLAEEWEASVPGRHRSAKKMNRLQPRMEQMDASSLWQGRDSLLLYN